MSAAIRFILISVVFVIALACVPDGSMQANGGIGGSGISSGPITAFGSVFVNGVEWELDDSAIEFENLPGNESDLEIGMVVVIEGDFSRDGTRGIARSLRYDDELEGPISAISDVGGDGLVKEVRVLRKTIVVERGIARFDDDDPAFTFDSMTTDDVVEVSGHIDQSGNIVATYIERKGRLAIGFTEVEFEGRVQGFAGGSSFIVDGVTVNFDPSGESTDLSGLPGGPANGLIVEIHGVLTAASEVQATKIEAEDGFDADVEKASVEGIVSDFTSLGDFRVAGQRVDATRAEFEHGGPALIRNGIKVEVEGPIEDHVLQAEEVELRQEDIRIRAAVARDEDVDPAGATLKLLGIRISLNAGTRIEDERDEVDPFGLDDIVAGDFLEVRGVPNGTGGVIATLVERGEVEKVELRGPVDRGDEGAGTVTILAIPIQSDPDLTDFEGEGDVNLDSATFFAQLRVGDLVSVVDERDGDATTIDLADEMEIERAAPTVGAGLAYLAPDLPEAVASAEDASRAADDGASSESGLQMVRTVRLYFATVEARTREARRQAALEQPVEAGTR